MLMLRDDPTGEAGNSPEIYKGIALFTPGGDLVYCIDPEKRSRWHMQLCSVLQDGLALTEPPHFLVPCYTATVDRWLDPHTQQVETFAEASPLVLRHRALLSVLFGVVPELWTAAPCPEGLCDPLVLDSYRHQFPQLWEEHDLLVRFEQIDSKQTAPGESHLSWSPFQAAQPSTGYVLRLFVSGNSPTTEKILQTLHHLLERSLRQPYTLKVIDIQKHPDQAEANQITATPTLLKVFPQPMRRIVGDLSDTQRVLWILSAGTVGGLDNR